MPLMSLKIFQEADIKIGLEVQDIFGKAPVNYKGREPGVDRENF